MCFARERAARLRGQSGCASANTGSKPRVSARARPHGLTAVKPGSSHLRAGVGPLLVCSLWFGRKGPKEGRVLFPLPSPVEAFLLFISTRPSSPKTSVPYNGAVTRLMWRLGPHRRSPDAAVSCDGSCSKLCAAEARLSQKGCCLGDF